MLLFLFNPMVFFDVFITSFKNPCSCTIPHQQSHFFKLRSLPAAVFQRNVLGMPDTRNVYVTYVPQFAVSSIRFTANCTVTMYRNGFKRLDRLSHSQRTLLLRCLAGAVNHETTATYTYVLTSTPIGNLLSNRWRLSSHSLFHRRFAGGINGQMLSNICSTYFNSHHTSEI
jgi:hypothetical protein